MAGWLAAGDRAGRGPRRRPLAGGAAGPARPSPPLPDRWPARRPGAPAHAARHHRLELRPARPRGADPVPPSGGLCRRLLRGRRGLGVGCRVLRTPSPSSPPSSTRACCSRWRVLATSRGSECSRRSGSTDWSSYRRAENGNPRGAFTRSTSWPSPKPRNRSCAAAIRAPNWRCWRPSTITCGRRWPGVWQRPTAPTTALRLVGALHWFWYLARPLSARGGVAGRRRWRDRRRRNARRRARRRWSARAACHPVRTTSPRPAPGCRKASPSGATCATLTSLTYALHVLGMWRSAPGRPRRVAFAGRGERGACFVRRGIAGASPPRSAPSAWPPSLTLRFDEARALFAESLALSREVETPGGWLGGSTTPGEMARFRGDDEQARALYEESLTLYQELDHRGRGGHRASQSGVRWPSIEETRGKL